MTDADKRRLGAMLDAVMENGASVDHSTASYDGQQSASIAGGIKMPPSL